MDCLTMSSFEIFFRVVVMCMLVLIVFRVYHDD